MVDKQSTIIVIFLAVSILMAGILAMGAVPEIFRQGEQLDLAIIQQHEDEARANQTLHEDLARERQNELENQARDKQRYQIINETNASLRDFEQRMKVYITESENRSARGAVDRQNIMENIQEISNQHDKVSKDHATIQERVNNLTQGMSNNLTLYGENSLVKFKEIEENQQQILKLLNSTK